MTLLADELRVCEGPSPCESSPIRLCARARSVVRFASPALSGLGVVDVLAAGPLALGVGVEARLAPSKPSRVHEGSQ
jgi:hypothetical protein